MSLWLTLAVNSVALGGLLFLLSSGFSLIFGLMRIPNLMHGSFFMLGAYFGVSLGDTVLDITLETRGPEHIAELLTTLSGEGYSHERVV